MGSYNWNWPILLKEPYFTWIVTGFGNTILIAVLAWAIAFPLGSAIGIARTADNRALRSAAPFTSTSSATSRCWCRCSSGTSWCPSCCRRTGGAGSSATCPIRSSLTAVVCLGLYTASRVAEQVRSGIEAIPRGQRNAGLAMGLTPLQVYRYVLIPVAYRTIIPPLTSDFLGVFKNSSLALTIGVLELTSQARQIEEYTFAAFEAFTVATVLYCLVTGLVILIMRIVEGRTRIAGTIAVGAQ